MLLSRNVSMSTVVVAYVVATVNDVLGGVTGKGERGESKEPLKIRPVRCQLQSACRDSC